jgi:acetylornithine deacetylase/succinyl-diaminopimelate desuccinylase-like protein
MDINWPAITTETVRNLQALLRLETVNPPGAELLAAEYLAGVLRAEGLDPLVLESAPGRGNVIARLPGSGEAAPLLLYGHTDVVPAEPAHWSHPPFGGEVHDGFVWGRGALDMKGSVAQQLMVFLLLKRQGVPLRRDVIFAATADEEVGGEDGKGMAWLVKHHPDRLRAEFGLTEMGGYNVDFAGTPIYPIQVAEKGTVWLKVRAHGRPAHASQPRPDNSVVRLARAVADLGRHGLLYHLCDAADGMLAAISAAAGGELGHWLGELRSPRYAEDILNGAFHDHPLRPMLTAITHNTATPTGLSAGYQTNVIPATAEAVVDGRNLPGTSTEALVAELRAVMGADLEYEVTLESPPLQTSHRTPLFQLMAETLTHFDPQAKVVPYLMSGATDAKYLAPLGVPSYGFMPIQLPPGFDYMNLFHAHDERAPVAGLGWGVQVLYTVVRAYCGQ